VVGFILNSNIEHQIIIERQIIYVNRSQDQDGLP